MRKLPIILLLASAAAAPSMAQAQDSDSRAERRAERRAAAAERSEARAERPKQSERAERPQRAERVERAERMQQAEQADRPLRAERRQRAERLPQAEPSPRVVNIETREQRPVAIERLRERRLARGADTAVPGTTTGDALVPRERRIRTIPDTQPVVADSRTETRRDRRGDYRNGNYTRWSNHWRTDRRYDWRRYRDRNRSAFRIGFYYDPFGWSYRRFNIGFNLWPSHYSSRYWLHDPWQYRLPPAYGPYRWVRYWDDAILVNIYTGEVEDVIHNFFW